MENVKPCKDWAEKLAARHPEDLSPVDRLALQQHLQTCPNCTAVYEGYSILENHIRARAQALSPTTPFPSLLSQLQQKKPAKQSLVDALITSNSDGGFTQIAIEVKASNEFVEVIPEDLEMVELILEDVVSHVLLDLFGSCVVDSVEVLQKKQEYTIQIAAGAEYSRSDNDATSAVKEMLASFLKELFGNVTVTSAQIGTRFSNARNCV